MRIVSLVPSLTLTAFELGINEHQMVGRTAWCIHPKENVENIKIVGGTKTPKLRNIIDLNPDLVLMDKEENPLDTYNKLKDKGFSVYVSSVRSLHEVPQMLESLGEACHKLENGKKMSENCIQVINTIRKKKKNRKNTLRVLPLIWHNPLMSVSSKRYAGSLLQYAGFDVVDINQDVGYPEVSISEIVKNNIEILLLSSEPHQFTIDEGNKIANMIEKSGGIRPKTCLIDGEKLTWFGSKTSSSLMHFFELHDQLIKE